MSTRYMGCRVGYFKSRTTYEVIKYFILLKTIDNSYNTKIGIKEDKLL